MFLCCVWVGTADMLAVKSSVSIASLGIYHILSPDTCISACVSVISALQTYTMNPMLSPDTCISACVSVSALQTYTMTPYTLLRHLYLSLCLGNMCPPNLYPMLSTRHLYLSLCLGNKCPPNLYPEPYALPRHLYLSMCFSKCPPNLYPDTLC